MKCNKQLLNSLKKIKDKAIRDQAVKEYKVIAETESCSYQDKPVLDESFFWDESPSGREFWNSIDLLLLEASE